jgi:hypothetical protein
MNTLMRSVPEDGDIVVREEQREGTPVYVLRSAPGADQILVQPCEAAIARALGCARRQHVRAWLTTGGHDFVLLEDFRLTAWSVFRDAHPHALLIGPKASAQEVIVRLHRYLRTPVVHWRPCAVVEPPSRADTLVIWDVGALDRMQQALLFRWIDDRVAEAQVISVAESPVFPLVLRGEFAEALYYRLNTVCLTLSNDVDV